MAECDKCDGTGSACNACNAGIMDCNCGPEQEPTMCDKCGGTGTSIGTLGPVPLAGPGVDARRARKDQES